MAWGADTSLGTQTAVDDTTEEFLPSAGGGISLNPGESAHCQIQYDNTSGSLTDDIIISFYSTLDDTSEDWDEKPFMTIVVAPDSTNAEDISVLVSGVYSFRIGFLSSGATDTYDVGGNYRKDGISL